MKYFYLLTIATLMTAINANAQRISDKDWAETTFVRYDFTDSSLPPEHHRSYYIGIDKDSIRVRITCYGELLRREVFPSTQQTLDQVKDQLKKQNLRKVKEDKTKAMPTGGTTDAIALFKGDDSKSFFSASVYAGIGTLEIDGAPEAAFLKALPVSIESIISKTRRRPQPPYMVLIPTQEAPQPNQPEVMPAYPGGEVALQNDIHQQMQLPEDLFVRKFKAMIKVTVVIDEEGELSDAWVNKGFNKDLDDEVVRCLKKTQRWNPGTRGGHPVAMMHEFTVVVLKD